MIDSLYLTEDSQDFSREEKPVLYPIFRVFLDYYTFLFTRTLYMDYFSKTIPTQLILKVLLLRLS
jgi:hypothetical protein